MMTLRRTLAQGGWELRQLMRNGEQLLISFVFPIAALFVMARTQIVPVTQPGFALAGALAMAVLSSAFTSQAISLAIDRRYGVLRMFGTTALGPQGLLAGKALAVAAAVLLQTAVILGIGATLGLVVMAPLALLVTLIPGVMVHVALAVLLGGTMRAETVIPVANLLWVLMVAAGALTPTASPLLALLPPGALGDALRAAVLGQYDVRSMLVLLVWSAALSVLARRALKWD